jgi:putative N6-adenine-specific DNA methylase
MKILAKTFAGLEEVLALEIEKLGGTQINPIKRGVEFEGDMRLLYRANLELRTALRILMPIESFTVKHEAVLYNKIKAMDWSKYLDVKQTFAIDAVVRSTIFTHSQYVGLKTKDAIADYFRDKFGKRPNVNTAQPDVLINIHLNEDKMTVSLDASGASLHKRGYRVDTLEAPINEVLAAGMIQLSEWDGQKPFVDAMCGSGTILTEAAMFAHGVPPQYGRDYFCFKHWQGFDSAMWEDVVMQANSKSNPNEVSVKGHDNSFQAIRVTERNVEAANLNGKIVLSRKDFFKNTPEGEPGVLMINPPYDERLKMEDAQQFYKEIGDVLKKQWKGWQVWIISGNLEAVKFVGLKPTRKFTLFNGAIECKFLKYEMY